MKGGGGCGAEGGLEGVGGSFRSLIDQTVATRVFFFWR